MNNQAQPNEHRPDSDKAPSNEMPWQRERRRSAEWRKLLVDYYNEHPELNIDLAAADVLRDHPEYAPEAEHWLAGYKSHCERCRTEFVRQAGIYADCRFDNFRLHGSAAEQKQQRAILKRLRAMLPTEGLRLWLSDLGRAIKAGQNILFVGNCGTGKDHLMHGLLWHVCGGVNLSYQIQNYATLRRRLKDAATSDGQTESTIINSLCEATLLCISDLVPNNGKPLSDFQADCLYQIVDGRMLARRPIWATLNLPTGHTMDEEGDERLTPPVWDRLRHGALIVACDWQCFRKPAEIIG